VAVAERLPRCRVQRCKRIARIGTLCKTHAVREADRLFSIDIRSTGRCIGTTSFWKGPEFPCAGPLQCCHLFSRRYRNIRWDERNAVAMCAAHHRYFDTRPIERDTMMLEHLELDYERLRREALDHGDWHLKLAKALGIEP
jgi:hypothetical protein